MCGRWSTTAAWSQFVAQRSLAAAAHSRWLAIALQQRLAVPSSCFHAQHSFPAALHWVWGSTCLLVDAACQSVDTAVEFGVSGYCTDLTSVLRSARLE